MISIWTAFIGAIVTFIAFLQWTTARQKVLLDLFDKRFAVYEELREVIGRHLGQGAASFEDVGRFKRTADRAQFLFGPEVTNFLEERRLDLTHAAYQDRSPPSPVSEDRRQAVEEKLVARLNRLTDFFRTLMYWLRPT